jgi:hypothetical protein
MPSAYSMEIILWFETTERYETTSERASKSLVCDGSFRLETARSSEAPGALSSTSRVWPLRGSDGEGAIHWIDKNSGKSHPPGRRAHRVEQRKEHSLSVLGALPMTAPPIVN